MKNAFLATAIIAAATCASYAQAAQTYTVVFKMNVSRYLTAPPAPGVDPESLSNWATYADMLGFPVPADNDGDGNPNWELGVAWSGAFSLPMKNYPISDSSTVVEFDGFNINGSIGDPTMDGPLSVFSDFKGTLKLINVQMNNTNLVELGAFNGVKLDITGNSNVFDISPLSGSSVDALILSGLTSISDLSPIASMSIGSEIAIDPGIVGYTKIPGSAEICQVSNAAKFTGMPQSAACE